MIYKSKIYYLFSQFYLKILRGVIGVLLLFSMTASWAQTPDAVAILAQKITANLDDDSLKATAIYAWVTRNIEYDHHFRKRVDGDTTLYQEPHIVIKTKKAVCIGYAKLVFELCKAARVEAYIVEGWVKNQQGKVEREEHAWNVVCINNNYYFMDATWGVESDVTSFYCLTPPSQRDSHGTVFSENHLPHDPLWQLSTELIDFDCFINDENCLNKKTPFAFKDSIKQWKSLDSLTRTYNSATRILKFNPKDLHAIRDLAGYYSQKAFILFSKYNSIRQAVKEKKRKPNERQSVLKLLDETQNYIKAAQAQYDQLRTFGKKNRYTDAHLNLDIIEENLANLEAERQFVLAHFKD